MTHPTVTKQWVETSNYLVILATPDERSLLDLQARVAATGTPHVLVREPDCDNEATALAIGPSECWKMFSALPLAGRVLEAA